MTKAAIKVVFRSIQPVEVEPGEYEYEYKSTHPLLADISTQQFTYEDRQTININTAMPITFSVVLPNNIHNRYYEMEYVRYLGRIYKIVSAIPYHPRVKITIGSVVKGEESKTIEEALNKK